MSLFAADISGPGKRALTGGVLSTIEHQLFSVIYFLQKDTRFHNIFYVTAFIQFVHTLENAFVDGTFAWAPIMDDSKFRMILRYLTLELFMVTEQVYWMLFSLAVAVVIAIVAIGVHMARSLNRGTVPPQSLSRGMQFLVGFAIAFEIPITRILLAEIECDYGHTGRNPYWHFTCFDTPGRLVVYIFSMASLLVFMAIVLMASFMHSFSPKSTDPTARSNTKTDMAYSAWQMSTVIIFRIAWRHPVWLSLWYLGGSLLLLGVVLQYQPFFWNNMNNFRCAIHAGTAWTGFCLLIISIVDNERSNVVSTMYLSLLLPVMWYFWKYSKSFLQLRIAEGKGAVVSDEACLTNEALLDRLRAKEDLSQGMQSFQQQLQAALVEVRTRFLIADSSPASVAQADRILRKGLKDFPESESLLLKYIVFVATYREDEILANAIVTHCRRLHLDDMTVRFEVFRLQKDMQRMRQLGARHGRKMDVISFEETQKTLRMGKYHHMKAREHIDGLLRDIAKGQADDAVILRRIEAIYRNEEAALEHYDTLLSRGVDHKEAFLSFSCFLRDVMLDDAAADAMMVRYGMEKTEQADGTRSEGAGSENEKSATSGVSSAHGRSYRTMQLTHARNERLSWLTWRMRIVTLLLLGIIVAVFLIYFFLTKKFADTLLNLNDSGARSQFIVILLQGMQCLRANTLTYNNATLVTCRDNLDTYLPRLRIVQEHLLQQYRTSYADQMDFYFRDQALLNVSSPNGTTAVWFSGAQMMDNFISSVEIVRNASAAKLIGFNKTRPDSFPEFFYAIENAPMIARMMDSSTVLYQLEAEQVGNWIEIGILTSVCVAGAVELCVVLFMFRPAVDNLFLQFNASIGKAKSITAAAARAGVRHMRAALADDDEDEDATTKPAEDEVSSLGSRRRASSKLQSPRLTIQLQPTQGAADQPASDGNDAAKVGAFAVADAMPAAEVDDEPDNDKGDEEASRFDSEHSRRYDYNDSDSERGGSDEESEDYKSTGDEQSRKRQLTAVDTDKPVQSSQPEMDVSEDIVVAPSSPSLPTGRLLELPSPSSPKQSSSSPFANSKPVAGRKAALLRGDSGKSVSGISESQESAGRAAKARVETQARRAEQTAITINPDEVEPEEQETKTTSCVSQKLSRKSKLQLLYGSALLVILAALVAFAVRGYLEVHSSKAAAVELVSASRHRYLSRYLASLALEVTRAGNASLVNGSVSWLNEFDNIRCMMRTVSHAASMSHQSLLFGGETSWNNMARTNNWDELHYDSPCSPLTPSKHLFEASKRCPGSNNRWGPTSTLLYQPQCMAMLPWADEGSTISNNPRVKFFTQRFNNASDCILFNAQNPYMMHGYHTLYTYLIDNGAVLADTPAAQLSFFNSRLIAYVTFEVNSKEYALGGVRLVLEYQYEALARLEQNTRIMIILTTIVLFVLLLQYFVLGHQMKTLLSQNLGMEAVVNRLQGYCEAAYGGVKFHQTSKITADLN